MHTQGARLPVLASRRPPFSASRKHLVVRLQASRHPGRRASRPLGHQLMNTCMTSTNQLHRLHQLHRVCERPAIDTDGPREIHSAPLRHRHPKAFTVAMQSAWAVLDCGMDALYVCVRSMWAEWHNLRRGSPAAGPWRPVSRARFARRSCLTVFDRQELSPRRRLLGVNKTGK